MKERERESECRILENIERKCRGATRARVQIARGNTSNSINGKKSLKKKSLTHMKSNLAQYLITSKTKIYYRKIC